MDRALRAPRTLLKRERPRPRETYCYLGDHRAIALTRRGQKIFLDTRDLGMTPHIAISGEWEPEVELLLRRLLPRGAAVAEVGANMGYHTLAMAAVIGPTGRLHAFEPNPDVLPLLRATLLVNGLMDRVEVHAAAVLDVPGTISLSSDPEYIGSGHVALTDESANYSRRVEVPAVPLDQVLAGLPHLDMLRMDAEGSEAQVLRGAEALIRRSPALRIVLEWSPAMLAARTDLGGLAAWITGLGFQAWRIGEAGALEPVAPDALTGLPHSDLLLSRTPPPPA